MDEEEDDGDDHPEDGECEEHSTERAPVVACAALAWLFGRDAGVPPLRLALLAQSRNDTLVFVA
jgi:hypothetical protein